MKVEFEFQGKGHDGDILVVDKALPNFRVEKMPNYVQTLPKFPILKDGQRAVLVAQGNSIEWKIRDPNNTKANVGSSLITTMLVIAVYKWFTKKKDEDEDE